MPYTAILMYRGHTHNTVEQGDVRYCLRRPCIDIQCDRAGLVAHIYIASNHIRGIAQKRLRWQSCHSPKAQCAFLASGEAACNKNNTTTGDCHNTRPGENEETTAIQFAHRSYLPCGCPR